MSGEGVIRGEAIISDVVNLHGARLVVSNVLVSTLSAALLLSIFQLFIVPVASIYISIYFISVYLLGALLLLRKLRFDLASKLFFTLLATQVVSLAWSPDRILGAREFLWSLPFLVIYMAARAVTKRREDVIVKILKFYVLAALSNSILVIIFRLNPNMEYEFLYSSLARIFINPNSLAMYIISPDNNVADVGKSGGFFLNANAGSVLLEVSAYLSIAVSAYGRRWFWRSIAMIHFIAVALSGSKSALFLLALAPFASWYVMRATTYHMTTQRRAILVLSLGAAIFTALAAYIMLQQTDIAADTYLNAQRRWVIWNYAASAFIQSPILGQGFGGWALGFANYGDSASYLGLNGDMPAHNGLLILWSQSGLFAALLGLLVVLVMFRSAFTSRIATRGRLISGAALAALSSVFIHSMGDNFGLFGEPHIQAPLAAFLGWVSARGTLVKS